MHSMYCLHKSGEVCTQFQEKTAIHFATLGATYIGHSSTRHVHNSMKSQLYTYLGIVKNAWYSAFIGCRVRWAIYAIRGKQLCTLIA